jgi:hypothetical protein
MGLCETDLLLWHGQAFSGWRRNKKIGVFAVRTIEMGFFDHRYQEALL